VSRAVSRAVAIAVLIAGIAGVAGVAHGQDGGLDASKLSKVPTQTKFVEAEYPAEAAAAGVEADVILLLDIDAEGFVTAVGIDTPADPPGMGFDEAAMLVAQEWEFEPAELDGKAIAVQITYRYKFRMKVVEAPPPPDPEDPDPDPEADPDADPDATPARAPVINFAGTLIERGTRLPLAAVVVTVFREDGDAPVGFETSSDGDGRFAFYDLAPGTWSVLIEQTGYYPYKTAEDIAARERVDVTYHLERGSYNPLDVTVTGERPRKEVSRTVLSAAEIDKVPGGAGDPLAVVQNFPGVARSDNPAEVIVRGSAPEDTQIFVDGIAVPIIYHFGGLKSVLPIGMLESIEFYPGNFSPSYGRATGGVIDVRTKQLAPEKLGGYADLSILDFGFYLETPLGDKGAIAIAGRRSHIDYLLNLVVPDDAGISLKTAPRYYDGQILASYQPTPAHQLGLFAFGSDDRLLILFDNPAELDPGLDNGEFFNSTTFYRAIGTYRYVPGPSFENELRLAVGHDQTLFTIGQLRFELDLNTVQLRDRARWQLNQRAAVSVGTDAVFLSSDVFVRLPPLPDQNEPPGGALGEPLTSQSSDAIWQPAVFAEAELEPIDGMLLLPGVRADYFPLSETYLLQPRATARWQLNEPMTVKGGAGLFAQDPTFAEDDEVFGNPSLKGERALHYSLGMEVRPEDHITFDVTGYYKDLWNLVSDTDALTTNDEGETIPLTYDNGGTGTVWGVEVVARHEFKNNLTSWIAYSLSRARRTDSGETESRLFQYDQTHNLTAVASYVLPRGWQVGGRFRLVSGNPITPVIGSIYNASADTYEAVYGDRYSARDDVFQQLDIRVDKRWVFQRWMLNAYLDLQNVLDRANPSGVSYNYDFTESTPQTTVPLIAILGLRGEF